MGAPHGARADDTTAAYVRGLVPLARFGIIAYRDYNDIDFVTRISQPSFDIERARLFMGGTDALGGGDHPEAVTQALRDSENLLAGAVARSASLLSAMRRRMRAK